MDVKRLFVRNICNILFVSVINLPKNIPSVNMSTCHAVIITCIIKKQTIMTNHLIICFKSI